MANFNWLNALPHRDWSEPDRGWRVLRLTRAGFLKRSQMAGEEPLEDAFHTWAAAQLHRNYVVVWDDGPGPSELIFVAMKENAAMGSGKRTNVTPIGRRTGRRATGPRRDEDQDWPR